MSLSSENVENYFFPAAFILVLKCEIIKAGGRASPVLDSFQNALLAGGGNIVGYFNSHCKK